MAAAKRCCENCAVTDALSSTDALPSPRFPAHGRVEYQIQGDCLIGDARGPFNLELVEQLQRLLPPLVMPLRGEGGWVHLCRFQHSALTSPEALLALEALMAGLVVNQVAPRRTAFVMDETVEGGDLMRTVFERSFARAGLQLGCFDEESAALRWLRS